MIILVGIGCFILGGIVGVITMGLCVASSNSRGWSWRIDKRRIKSNADSKRRYNQRYYWRDCIS